MKYEELELVLIRTMYLEEKTQNFINYVDCLANFFLKYRGELIVEHTHRQQQYLDFLISMKKLGFTRDEVEDCILTHAEIKEL